MGKRKSGGWLISTCTLLVLVFAYASCYVGLCESVKDNHYSYYRGRYYRTKWIAIAFVPAAWIESKMIGMPVGAYYPIPGAHRLARYD